MEKDIPKLVVSLSEHRKTQETAKRATIAVVQETTNSLVRAARKQYDQISEDSYVSRMEADKALRFLSVFSRKIARVRPGQTVNLCQTIVDYGHDPEAEAADIASGITHISDADREELEYQQHISLVSPIIDRLKTAGVTIKTGTKRVMPEDEFED